MPFTGEVDISGILAKLGDPKHGLAPARPPESLEETDQPYRAAYGTIDISTSMVLAVVPKIIWDVNGYYRSLGIQWPYTPSRKDLREAFFEHDGHSSERLTYYMKQLLDPTVRAEYDAMPLGSRYRDKYVVEADMRKLADLAAEVSEEEGRLVTVDDLMEQHAKPPALPPLPPSSHIWDWGFYALKSRKYETLHLEEWITLLTAEFAKQNMAGTISIGYIGSTREPFEIRRYEDRDVFFLNEDTTPTTELAETAVSKFKAQKPKGTKWQKKRS